MSNASRCLSRAALYDGLADRSDDQETRRAFRALAAIWREIEPLAANYDREPDPQSKERIYALIDVIALQQRKVA